MSDLIKVKVKLPHMRGKQIAGPSGATYMVHVETSALHLMKQGIPAADPGCHRQDAEEFRQFDSYDVEGSPPPPAPRKAVPPPPRPVSDAPESPKGPESPSGGSGAPGTPEGPRERLIALGRAAWLKNAEHHGIPDAETLEDDDLVTAIMMAAGYDEDVAMGVEKVDPADIQPKADPLDKVPDSYKSLKTKEWLSLTDELGVPLTARDKKKRKSIRDAIVSHFDAEGEE